MNWLPAAWLVYLAIFGVNHIRVRRIRHAARTDETGARRDPAALRGLLLEGAAIAIVWIFRIPERTSLRWLAAGLIAASLAWTILCLKHLGDQWRIKAVVTLDHKLVTTGPYALVRHPIYLGLLGMLIGNAIAIAPWPAAIAALIIYIAGTELRVRSEDRLLANQFPKAAATYQARTPAYLPGLR